MNRYRSILNEITSALIPTMMSGCAAWVLVRALGFSISWGAVYMIALLVSAACVLGRKGLVWTIGAAVLIVGASAAISAVRFQEIRAFLAAAKENGGFSNELVAVHSGAGAGLAMLITILIASVTVLFYLTRTGKSFSMIIPVAVILIAFTLCRELSIWIAVPGMVGCVAAFATGNENSGDNIRLSVLAAALLLVMIAVLISPASGTTWKPLEELAEKIRTLTDEYVRFSEERIAFSINEKGYDHGGMINNTVVSMLGGPADPSEDPVMKVKTDTNILLRGTIRQNYTGYSWVDERVKARYLYYDFTHAATRNAVFDAKSVRTNKAFKTVNITVTMTGQGTSTLFVPAHMSSFDMDLSDAVYYNSTGELFLTRDVRAGDTYSLSAQIPASSAELIETAKEAENKKDNEYAHAQQEYTALPDGIDSRIYQLTLALTQDYTSNIEKAIAIRDYLAENYEYTMDAGYPTPDKDFVSWFLIEERKGYCSYFASALTVMCRMAGIPARYVEGYYVQGSDGETVVTGYNAHAWTEIYLKGIGWTAFDATAAAYSAQSGLPEETMPISPNINSNIGDNDDPTATAFENDDTAEVAPEEQSEAGGLGDNGGNSPDGDGSGNSDNSNSGDSGSDSSDNSEGDGSDDPNGDGSGNGSDNGSDDGSESDGNSGSGGNLGGEDAGNNSDGDLSSDGDPTPSPDPNDDPSPSPDPDDDPTPSPDPNDDPTPTPDPGDDPTPSPTPEPTATPTPEPTATPDPENSPEPTPTPGPDETQKPDEPEQKKLGPWIWILIGILIVAVLVFAAVMWIRRRLTETDPMMMAKKSRNARKAAMIMYRAILTLLVRQGYAPMNGETPEAFAARVCQNIPNEAYERFAAAAARSSYSGGSLTRMELEDGRDAYIIFLNGMKTSERIRYDIERVLHGIGDTKSIP